MFLCYAVKFLYFLSVRLEVTVFIFRGVGHGSRTTYFDVLLSYVICFIFTLVYKGSCFCID